MAGAFKPGAPLGPRLMGPLQQAMAAGGLWLARKVKQSINTGNRTGGNPSKPFDPPNKQTGRLYKSITSVTEVTPAVVSVLVGTNVEYARALEYGFAGTVPVKAHSRKLKGKGRTTQVKAHSRKVVMLPRPFLRPALLKHKADFAKVVVKHLRMLAR